MTQSYSSLDSIITLYGLADRLMGDALSTRSHPLSKLFVLARTTSRCPECRTTFGLNLSPLHGHIGCKLYRCRWCDNVTQSHRGEWPSKSRMERRYYVLCSAIYTIFATVVATFGAATAFEYLEGQTPNPLWILSTAVAVAIATSLWQGGRVFNSLQRDGNGYIDPKTVSFFSLETNMLWTLAIPAVTATVMVLMRNSS